MRSESCSRSGSRSRAPNPSAGPALAGLSFALLLLHPSLPSARLVDAIGSFDGSAEAADSLPRKLSRTGLYVDMAAKTKVVTAGIAPFEVNNPLWSDGSHKQRWITLPAGSKAVPTATDKYQFPDRTVMVKNFAIDTVAGDSSSRIVVETRFLVFRKDEEGGRWHGMTYKWRLDQTDAELVDQDFGENRVFAVKVKSGTGTARKGKRWHYPSRDECAKCHTSRGTLGFITPQLNRPSKANPGINQLQDLMNKGILSANPVAGKTDAFRWVGLEETGAGATLEAKSRSYLASNCSHCHGNESFPGPQHDFDYFDPARKIDAQSPGGYIGRPPVFPNFPFPQLIYAGRPESSLVVKRLLARGTLEDGNPEQMPPIATYQPDSAAVKVIRDWICSMGVPPVQAKACKLPKVQSEESYWAPAPTGLARFHGGAGPGASRPRLLGGILKVPPGDDPALEVALFDPRGRKIALARKGAGEFLVREPLRPGVYLLLHGRAVHRLSHLP